MFMHFIRKLNFNPHGQISFAYLEPKYRIISVHLDGAILSYQRSIVILSIILLIASQRKHRGLIFTKDRGKELDGVSEK
jgi:hypothetical protein